jgi:hypothetical protein
MNMNTRWSPLLIAALALLPAWVRADCRAQSPPYSVALIELYTSEGCNSCPPADRWLSQIDARGDAAVPLALHVDYWDGLGWKDRFANAAFTARQHEQMRRQQTAFVFTPQVIVQGRDFRQWGVRGEPAATVAAINARPARASIELVAEPQGDSAKVDLRVRVPDARDRAHAVIAVALVQDGLVSDVKAGENSGRRLAHDHVVRQWRSGPSLDAGGEARMRLAFTLPADTGPLSVVAFAEDAVSGEVLQALALPLCARP